ncbi:hypothetical protein HKBW3C_03007, partial [Candidatus Hakubella thermalkaliphila]
LAGICYSSQAQKVQLQSYCREEDGKADQEKDGQNHAQVFPISPSLANIMPEVEVKDKDFEYISDDINELRFGVHFPV